MDISTVANPRQAVLLTSRGGGKDNVMALAWHTPVSFAPMMYAVAVSKENFSCGMLRDSKVFVVNFMSTDFEKEITFCGRHSGEQLDKLEEIGLVKEEAKSVDCPRIAQALGYLECRIVHAMETGDHYLFIAAVENAELKGRGKRPFHLGDGKFTTTVE